MEDLLRAGRIVKDPAFKQAVRVIEEAEKERVYCRHGLEHLMDVARIGCIMILENGADIDKDIMYAAALIHDLGRADEYTDGTPHHEAGARYARQILPGCGFSEEETEEIAAAVDSHRGDESSGEISDSGTLAHILYAADKKSRLCFACGARDTCKWPEEKMNLELEI